MTLNLSIQHLSFKCPHAREIWSNVLRWLQVDHDPCEWSSEVQWLLMSIEHKEQVFAINIVKCFVQDHYSGVHVWVCEEWRTFDLE